MSKMALVSVVVSLVPEMALHPALSTVNQWVLKSVGTQESVDGEMLEPSKAM